MIVDYLRPKSIKEATEYKKAHSQARFMGGGTSIRKMGEDITVVDLQNLPLKEIEKTGNGYRLGTLVTLEQLFGLFADQKDLQLALKIEASKNQRNQATLGGFLMLSDGRSPFFTCLRALRSTVVYECGEKKTMGLDEFVEQREQFDCLITHLDIEMPEHFVFESVGRSPLDRPIVCLAKAGYEKETRICVGGFGKSPTLLKTLPADETAATELLQLKDDAWASARYRSSLVLTLLKRYSD